MKNEQPMIDANALLIYLETIIKMIENNKHCYEVFDRSGGRYPVENIYKEIIDLVLKMVR